MHNETVYFDEAFTQVDKEFREKDQYYGYEIRDIINKHLFEDIAIDIDGHLVYTHNLEDEKYNPYKYVGQSAMEKSYFSGNFVNVSYNTFRFEEIFV